MDIINLDNKWEMHAYNFMQYIVKEFHGSSKTGSFQQTNQIWELFKQTHSCLFLIVLHKRFFWACISLKTLVQNDK